jgi:PAS domain S-box-containing protein
MRKQHLGVETKDDGLDAEVAANLGKICLLLHRHTGHDFNHYKEGTLLRRIRRRIQLQHLGSVADYVKKLENDAAEAAVLLKDLLIGVTQFFRDPEAFQVLAQEVLPRIVENKTGPIRIWIPGCASGEEAYSLAILLREQLNHLQTRAQIFATDLDTEVLAEARQGRYASEIAEQVSSERLARFFVREGNRYQATEELRDLCIFSEHSLIRDPPFSQLDLISCRNVLIYLGAELQKRLFPLFHYALRPGGFLFLGPSEGIAGSPGLFEPLDAKNRIFHRKETATRPRIEFPIGMPGALRAGLGTPVPSPSNGPVTHPMTPAPRDKISAAFESALRDEYTFPAAVINERGDALFVAGPISRYLQMPAGAVMMPNLLESFRGRLRHELRLALSNAKTHSAKVLRDNILVEVEDRTRAVRLIVRPMPAVDTEAGLFLVVLQEIAPSEPNVEANRESHLPVVEQLENELRTTRLELKTTVEELETANEELKSSNEELISTNEELQSANEEMQTSREELQSVNEELETLNTELHQKVAELAYVASFPEHNPNPIVEADMEGRVRYTNPAAARLFPDLAALGSAHPWLADWQAAAQRLRRTPGSDAGARTVVLGERTYHQILYLVGDESVMRSYGLDITERTRAEETLRASEERFRTLSDNAQDSIARFDRDGRYLYVNPFLTRALGLPAEAIVGKTPEELGRNAGVENWEARLREVFASGQPLRLDRRSVDGRWHDAHLIPEFRGDQVETVLVSARDITDRKRADEALRQSEDLLSFSLSTAQTGAWDLDLVDHTARRSPQHDQIFGYHEPLPQWTYEMFIEHVVPEDREAVDRQFRHAIATHGDWSFECRILRPDGATRWIWAAGRHRSDESGQPRHMAGIVQDITLRKQAQAALIEAHSRTSAILANIADAFYSLDAEWRFVAVNPAAERAPFDRPASELVGKVIWDVFPKIPGTRIHQHYLDAAAKQSHQHYEAQSPLNGRWYEVFIFPRVGGLDVYMRDIDERKRLERLYAVLSQVNEAIVRTPGEQPLYHEVCRIVAEQGDFPLVWIGLVQERAVRPVAAGGSEQSYLEKIRVEIDGELGVGPTGTCVRENRPVVNEDFTTNPVTAPWRQSALGHGLRASAAFPLRKDGKTIGALTLYAGQAGVFDAAELQLIESLCADLSYALAALEHERRRTEMEQELRIANVQLMEADQRKNEFLAMLSHELRNPLTPVRNSLYILEHAAQGSERGKHALDVIGRQVGQLTRLVDDLLDVTRVSRNKILLQRGPLEFGEIVRRAVEDYRSLFEGKAIVVETIFAPERLPINGDRERLAQAIGNLLQNAAKFTPAGGLVKVGTAAVPSRGRAVLRVIDNGAGMEQAILRRLFQPFMQAEATLDRSKGGLGLGLALVKGLVEMHGGEVCAHSDGPGKGAEFVIELPLDTTADPTATPSPTQPQVGSRRVLIIEDNVDAADSLREVLEFGGHLVEVAYNGLDGVAKARHFRPDIVLCDIGLPGMDGYEVARAFRADETLKDAFLVALSGYALPEDLQRAWEAGFDKHIAKPPTIEKIEDLLKNAPKKISRDR